MIGKFVPGEGNENAYVLLCGEAPGRMESSIGKPFCGISGQELNRYLLMQAGIRRQDCWTTNIVRYRPDEENSDPTIQDIERDEPYLLAEIDHIKPKVIVPLGRIAAQYFLGPIDMEFSYSLPYVIIFCNEHKIPGKPFSRKDRKDSDLLDMESGASQRLRSLLGEGAEAEQEGAQNSLPFMERAHTQRDDNRSSLQEQKLCESSPSRSSNVLGECEKAFSATDSVQEGSRIDTREYPVDTEKALALPSMQDLQQGQSSKTSKCCEKSFEITVFSLYHPAAGLHQADRYSKFIYNGFKRLGLFLNRCLDRSKDLSSHDSTDYSLDLNYDHPPAYLYAVDTEGYPSKPWGLSYSWHAGCAHVIKADNLLQALRWSKIPKKFIFHNALWDLKVLRGMGINIPYDKLDDSMLMSHLLCLEPKKLKALAYRECGMEMEDYKEVIKEADDRISRLWLERVYKDNVCPGCGGNGELTRAWKRNPNKFTKEKCGDCAGDGTKLPKPETQLIFNSDFTSKLYTPESTGRRLRAFLSSSGNYRSKWYGLTSDVRSSIESTFGKFPEVTLDDVEPRERAINYSARDADATLRVYHRLHPRIKEMGLERAYEIDLGCIPIIDRMHQNGILVDKQYLQDLDTKFEKEQYLVLQKMYDEVGVYFSPTSPPQMKRELGKLGIKNLDSTNERTLQLLKIQTDNPKVKNLIDLGLEYRELSKMRGTYTYRLINEADENSRIHTTFILSAQEGEDSAEAPSTGRLSSRNPNLQNIPVGQGRGEMIRAAFIAKPGCSLLSVDLSQIELRVGAHLAHEVNMIEAFKSGKDLHTFTASKMFNVPYDQVDKKKHRYPAKSINFGIFYGMSKYRLQSELAVEGIIISLEEAQGFIDAWFAIYPGISEYMHNVQAEARQNYFVRTMFGRIRYLPNVHSKDPRAREEALRQAGNHPVQGSSGDLLKIWISNVNKNVLPHIRQYGYCEPLLTIHDEIVLECSEDVVYYAAELIKAEVDNCIKLDVPLIADYKIGKTWTELK